MCGEMCGICGNDDGDVVGIIIVGIVMYPATVINSSNIINIFFSHATIILSVAICLV